MSKRRLVTLMIHPDGDVESRTYRWPLWLVRTGLITGSVVAVLVVLGVVLYTPIARTCVSPVRGVAVPVPFRGPPTGQLMGATAYRRELSA